MSVSGIILTAQARTWISNIICLWSLFVFGGLRLELAVHFVDIGGIVDHHYLLIINTG